MPKVPSRPVLPRAVWLLLPLLLAACGDRGGPTEEGGTPQTPYASTPDAPASATSAAAGLTEELRLQADAALDQARTFLLAARDESGAWGDPELGLPPNVGYTAMAAAAVIAATPAASVAEDPHVKRALDWLAARQKDDGSIWDNAQYVNYMTSAAAGAFALAKIAAYRNVELRARDFLAASQIRGEESDRSYGGFPYKQDQGQDADLSNLQFAAQALHDTGLPADHEVWQRMRVYLSRVQNRSETNTSRFEMQEGDQPVVVVSGDDGGAGYGPGTSKAGLIERGDGTFETRSYGSMTYALLKCLLLAGVDPDDPRVQAASDWIRRHYTLDRNPGFEADPNPEQSGQQGWYYYVYTLARTLAEYERRTKQAVDVEDANGRSRSWRADVVRALLERRRDDGAWVNDASERWEEGAPVLATSYAVVALAEALGRFR